MISRKLGIRDEPNIPLRCSGNVKQLVLPMKNTSRVSTQHVPVFSSTTRALVGTCVRVVPANAEAFWSYTRGRVEWTHGVFQRFTHRAHRAHRAHHTPQHTTQHNMTHHNPPQQHDHNTTRRQTERERRQRKKTRQEKREDSCSLWWFMAVPS